MTIGIIELNDLGIQVSCDDEIVVTSPGCALINNGELLVGTDALKLIRLLPSWTSNHFWNNLNTNPIPNARVLLDTTQILLLPISSLFGRK